MRRFLPFCFAVLCGLLVVLTGRPASAGPTTEAGGYRVSITTDPPVVPAQGKVNLLIQVSDRTGKPISGLTIRVLTKMPGMDMGERENTALPAPDKPGAYTAPATFAMEGGYESTLAISGSLGSATARLPLQTGENTQQSTGAKFPLPLLMGAILLASFGTFLVWRMHQSGQRFDVRGVINRQTIGALLVLAMVIGGAVFAVRHLRRPGALTPIDAQAMDMSYLPAPPGFAPVELASVTRGSIESTARYAATAVAFSQQPVYSRVTGTLLYMPFYAGNRVKKGQLLARLDTTQTQPQQAAQQAGAARAAQGVAVARAEQEQAEADIRQARAELSGKRTAVTEARDNVRLAQEAKANAEAVREATRAQIVDAEAQASAVAADAAFAQAQFERSSTLLQAGAVSSEEFQKDRAQAKQAQAKTQQARAQIARMRSEARAQEAAVRQADAQIRASQTRVQTAQAELSAFAYRIQGAQAARDVARQKVEQAQSEVAQAQAALASATATQGYAQIRAPFDAVIVARQISPGTLVNPGQAILTLAQIDRVRVQASVAQGDLALLRVGTPLRLSSGSGRERKFISARVTSIVPAVDANARTGIVEAVVENPGQTILPGQYMTMDLTTGTRPVALRVPNRALVYRPASGPVASNRTEPVVWVAQASGEAGQFTVRPVSVQIGLQNRDQTEIVSGVSEGQRVVVTGATYLREGDTVAEVTATPNPVAPLPSSNAAVLITERGFEPSSVSLRAGVPVRITFTRKTDATCAKEVVFPDYGINKSLPLNTPVIVSFTPKKGAFAFACGMNMIKGKVVAE